MNQGLFELKTEELENISGGALGLVGSFIVGGVVGIVVVGGIIVIAECVKG